MLRRRSLPLSRPARSGNRARAWLGALASALLCGLALAACSGDTPSAETGTVPAETGRAAPETGASELVALLGPTEGTCAEEFDSGSVQWLACSWLADANTEACPRLTGRVLDELFGGTQEGCEFMIGRLTPATDKSTVTFESVTRTDDGAAMTVNDGPRRAAYELTFVLEDGSWALDNITLVSQPRPQRRVEPRERDAQAETEIKNLLVRWYRDLDPGVCDSMTDEMLDFGWGKTGDAGRDLCKEHVAKAERLEDVTVRRPLVNGDKVKAKELYTQGGERLIDEVRFVRENGVWLVNAVRFSGFAP